MDVRFVMFKANGTRHEFPLRKERTVVGRTNNCDLRIPLSSVSRQHCEILIADGKVKLRDLGSSNGTYHNSTRVTAATLKAGDEIVIGPVVFTVVVDGRPAKLEAKRTVLNTDASSAGVNMAPSEAITPAPSNRAQTAEAMQSAASALAEVMDEDVNLELPGDEPNQSDIPTTVENEDDDDEVLSLEPINDEAPASSADSAMAADADDDVLSLAEDDEPLAVPKPEALELDDDEAHTNVESEAFSPTTELDDPIAALGRMVTKRSDDEIILLPDDEEEQDKDKK